MELGIYTFGDLTKDPVTGRSVSPQVRMDQMMEMARLADQAGLDVMGVGEHHGAGFVDSAPAAMIAAMAAVTKRLRLTSASTSIGTADPVRVFQDYATADLIAHGRIELVLGRGAFTENFPLFGYDLGDYDAVFSEKVQLLLKLNSRDRVTWSGRFRPALRDAEIAPRPAQASLPLWIGAGSPASVARAAAWGLPLTIPVLGGLLDRYGELAARFREAWDQAGHAAGQGRVAHFGHLHLTAPGRSLDDFFPYYSSYLAPLFRGPMPREAYGQMLSPQGSLVAGDPGQVVDKILVQQRVLGSSRFVGQIDIGGQPFGAVLAAIERFASEVAPAVRKATRP